MSFAYAYDAIQKIVHAKAEGVLTADDGLDYLNAVIADENIAPGFVELFDVEAVDDLQLEYEDTTPFADIWRQYQAKGCAGTIIYAPTDVNFELMRTAQATIPSADEAGKTPLVVVRTREEIVEQLGRIRS